MPTDALTLAAVADEFERDLLGARVEDVIQPTPSAVALQCWGGGRNRWLIASAHPQLARVHLTDGKPRKLAAEPPSFVMLLRKHLEGARLVEVRQPAWERVLELGFARGADGGGPTWLVAELTGRLSNLILRDAEGIILGALKLVGSEVNRVRTIAPHVRYEPPPPQTRTLGGQPLPRLRGEHLTAADLRAAAEDALAAPGAEPAHATGGRQPKRAKGGQRRAPTVADLLLAQVEGFGRDLARESAARGLGDGDASLAADCDWEAVAAAARGLADLRATRQWRPTLVYADEASTTPTAYAVYEPRQFAGARLGAVDGVNALLATFYAGAEWRVAVEGAKGELRHLLTTQRDRCIRKGEALRGELAAVDEAARLREEADILLAFQTEVPAHAATFTMENPFVEAPAGADGAAPTITLALDPRLSAVENANKRYARYHKLQRATGLIPPQIEANTLELARVEQVLTDLALAETPAEIAQVRGEVVEAGYLRDPNAKARAQKAAKQQKAQKYAKGGKAGKGAKQPQQPRRETGGAHLKRTSADGFTLLVGKNSRQNEDVTFHQAAANDIWLHARGVPGAHVIVKSGGRPVPEATLREAAALAAFYSQSRAAGTVPVDHTEQRYVRHMKGGGPGMVTYERERTLYVAPADPGAE